MEFSIIHDYLTNVNEDDKCICHNGFSLDLVTTKIKWSRHRSFLYECDRSPGVHVLKLGIEIPNLKHHNWSARRV